MHTHTHTHTHIDMMQTLRRVLDSSGLQHVEIVAADSAFSGISLAMLGDKDLNASVSIVGYVGYHLRVERTVFPLLLRLPNLSFVGCWVGGGG